MDKDQAPQPQDAYRKPLPVITPLNKPFWDYAPGRSSRSNTASVR